MSAERKRIEHGEVEVSRTPTAELECRQCDVICERVVSPWRCLRSHSTCVYAFEEGDTMYFGCLHKVFLPELDISPFSEAKSGRRTRTDPYGVLRVFRSPYPHCPVTIERAYAADKGSAKCMNPGFVWSGRIGGAGFNEARGGRPGDRYEKRAW